MRSCRSSFSRASRSEASAASASRIRVETLLKSVTNALRTETAAASMTALAADGWDAMEGAGTSETDTSVAAASEGVEAVGTRSSRSTFREERRNG